MAATRPPGRPRVSSRQAVEAAAVELFLAHGFEQTTVDDIAAAAGIDAASRLVVVTDPGSQLEATATDGGYRAVFLADDEQRRCADGLDLVVRVADGGDGGVDPDGRAVPAAGVFTSNLMTASVDGGAFQATSTVTISAHSHGMERVVHAATDQLRTSRLDLDDPGRRTVIITDPEGAPVAAIEATSTATVKMPTMSRWGMASSHHFTSTSPRESRSG